MQELRVKAKILSLVLMVSKPSSRKLLLVSKSKLYFVLIIYYHFGYVMLFDYIVYLTWVSPVARILVHLVCRLWHIFWYTLCVHGMHIKKCLTYIYNSVVIQLALSVMLFILSVKKKKYILLQDCISDVVASRENWRFPLTILLVQNPRLYSWLSSAYVKDFFCYINSKPLEN